MTNTHPSTEQLVAKLLAYVRQELHEPSLTYAEPLTQLHGGYETYTYRFVLQGGQARLPGPLVLRLYPAFFGAENAVWESTVQQTLADAGYPVPQVYLTCTDLSVLGGAFFIMAFLPGQPLMSAPPEIVPEWLGKTHAALHGLDPAPLVQALRAQNIAPAAYRLNRRMVWLQEQVRALPWIGAVVQWLTEQRPAEPATLAICHGDFHPLNILVDGARVSAVLDWPGFLLADPALDVANTLVLLTIPAKHVATTMSGFAGIDWDLVGQRYLVAYQTVRPLDGTNLPYYQVRRSVHALFEGFEGQVVWQHPAIVDALVTYIRDVTGISIILPTNQPHKQH